eukprot:RCo049424
MLGISFRSSASPESAALVKRLKAKDAALRGKFDLSPVLNDSALPPERRKETLKELLKAIHSHKGITALAWNNAVLSEKEFKHLSEHVKSEKPLAELDLSGCPVTLPQLDFLVSCLNSNRSVGTLHLSNCRLGNKSCELLSKLCSIHTLTLKQNEFDGLGISCLVEAAENSLLRNLDCSYSALLQNDKVAAVAKALVKSQKLVSLYLQHDRMSPSVESSLRNAAQQAPNKGLQLYFEYAEVFRKPTPRPSTEQPADRSSVISASGVGESQSSAILASEDDYPSSAFRSASSVTRTPTSILPEGLPPRSPLSSVASP